METKSNRIEIRVIGTRDQLARADAVIRSAYKVDYQSYVYSCKYPDKHFKQYYKVYEKEVSSNVQNDKTDS